MVDISSPRNDRVRLVEAYIGKSLRIGEISKCEIGFGELFYYAALREVFDSLPAISRIFYKTAKK